MPPPVGRPHPEIMIGGQRPGEPARWIEEFAARAVPRPAEPD
ncbi:hypothetical protein [Streptomyces sp. NPDC005423]